jgi:hypothetical protein
VLERFYSGQRNGPVTVREGAGGVKKRPLEPRSVLFKQGEKGIAGGHDSECGTSRRTHHGRRQPDREGIRRPLLDDCCHRCG